MPTDEKMVKFEQLASKRTEKILHNIASLRNLANRSNYHYTDEHIAQMLSTIRDALNDAESDFAPKQAPNTSFAFHGISHEISEEALQQELLATEEDDSDASDTP